MDTSWLGHSILEVANMKMFFGFICLLLLGSCSWGSSLDANPTILGGRELDSSDPGFHSAVGIGKSSSGTPHCTGVLVSSQIVVTAAHCVPPEGPLFVLFAKEGDASANSFLSVAVVDHARFLDDPEAIRKFRPNFDVAWLRMEMPAPAGFHPARLLTQPNTLESGIDLALVGYGWTEDEKHPRNRRITATKLYDYVDEPHARSLLLFGRTPGQSSCYGDSGGPAFVRDSEGQWVVAGITRGDSRYLDLFPSDWNYEDCSSGFGLYTAVGDYAAWIERTAGVSLLTTGSHKPEFSFAETTVDKNSFVEWCTDAQPTAASYLTVSAMLALAGTVHCDVAAERLNSRNEISFSLRNAFANRGIHFADSASLLVTDVRPLGSLTRLERLSFSEDELKDLLPLRELSAIKDLSLRGIATGDLAPLAGMTSLERLRIDEFSGGDISTLGKLTRLRHLTVTSLDAGNFRDSPEFDLSVLRDLTELASVDLDKLNLKGWSALEGWASLAQLTRFRVRGEGVGSLVALAGAASLSDLALDNARVMNVAPLATLHSLRRLSLVRNGLSDVSALHSLVGLTELDISDNPLPYPFLCPIPERLRRVCRLSRMTDVRELLVGDMSHDFVSLGECVQDDGLKVWLRFNKTRSELLSRQVGASQWIFEAVGRKDSVQPSLSLVAVSSVAPTIDGSMIHWGFDAAEINRSGFSPQAIGNLMVRLGETPSFQLDGYHSLRWDKCQFNDERWLELGVRSVYP